MKKVDEAPHKLNILSKSVRTVRAKSFHTPKQTV